MHLPTVAFGGACIAYGLFAAVARETHPHLFAKLGPMKAHFGERGGWVVHALGYTIMPLVLGSVLLWNGLHDGSVAGP